MKAKRELRENQKRKRDKEFRAKKKPKEKRS
jgi:hypothetical protein